MSRHLSRPNAYCATDMVNILDALDAVLENLFDEPVKSLDFLEIFSRLPVQRMLKSGSRESSERRPVSRRDDHRILHLNTSCYYWRFAVKYLEKSFDIGLWRDEIRKGQEEGN